MEPKFICEFNVSLEEYKYWAKHPLGAMAVKNRKKSQRLRIAGLVLSLVVLGSGAAIHSFPYALLGGAFLLVFLGRLFLVDNILLKKQYDAVCKMQKDGLWNRAYRFADKLTVRDGRNTAEYEYSEISRLTQDEGYFILWLNADMVMRLPKGAFTLGAPEEFRAYLEERAVSVGDGPVQKIRP